MKLLTFRTKNELKLGIKTEKGVLPVPNYLFTTVEKVIEIGSEALGKLADLCDKALEEGQQGRFLDEETLDLAPCVPDPGKIVCVGLNYRKHAEESNMAIPETPILFNKYNNTLVGHGDDIPLPDDSEQVDYEAELAIVIGRKAKKVSKDESLDYVFGYCNANDLSARDLQFRSSQWLLGKCLDGFCPLGPYLVTADEIPNPNALQISCTVNGEVRQNSNTSDMIFHCDEIISYVSHYMTLYPGDVILTGTPEGVVLGYPEKEQVWLKDGDEMTIEIEHLGALTNTLKK